MTEVETSDDVVRVGSVLLASGLERRHEQVFRLITKYKRYFEDMGTLKANVRTGKTKGFTEYLLNYNQVMFLFTLFRGSEVITKLSVGLIKSASIGNAIDLLNSFDVDDLPVRYVYAMQDDRGRIKIGISNNPERRVKEIQAANGGEVKLIMVKETKNPGYQDETALQGACTKYLIHSEWFQPQAMGAIRCN